MLIAILIIVFYVIPAIVISIEARKEIKAGFIGTNKLVSYTEMLFLILCPFVNLGCAIALIVQSKIFEKIFNSKSEEE